MPKSTSGNNRKSTSANAFRVKVDKDIVTLQFGLTSDPVDTNQDDESIKIVGEIKVQPEMLVGLISNLALACYICQEEHGVDLGLNFDKDNPEVLKDAKK